MSSWGASRLKPERRCSPLDQAAFKALWAICGRWPPLSTTRPHLRRLEGVWWAVSFGPIYGSGSTPAAAFAAWERAYQLPVRVYNERAGKKA